MAAAPHVPPGMSGLAMARHIVRAEGVLGLYRGFGASIVTFVPSSALWWGSYGFYQRLIWQQVGVAHVGLHGRMKQGGAMEVILSSGSICFACYNDATTTCQRFIA